MNEFCSLALPPLVTAAAVCAAVGPVFIPFLHRLKFGQEIRTVGPKSHQKKSGTPTMGGIMMLVALSAAMLVWTQLTPVLAIALVLTFGHALIGFIDDYIKVIKKRNLGLTVKQKLLLQGMLAAAYIYYVESHAGKVGLDVWVPCANVTLELGWGYYVLAFLLLVGTTNAVNLTDGLDGLVSCVSLPVLTVYAALAYAVGMTSLTVFACGVLGSCLGFLVWNKYPARVFMGDTGSLALGGAVAALALLTHTELLLVVIGVVYVSEALSVIMQVSYFKITHGRRIFRMTPIHHHFELGGWRETKVVAAFTIVSCVASATGYILWCAK